MPTFGQIITMLSAIDQHVPEMSWSITSDGILKIEAYVGIENHDLYKQGREMFAPID